MNTVDLQALGLEEMNEGQMQSVDAGFWAKLIAAFLAESALNYKSSYEAFMEGHNAVY